MKKITNNKSNEYDLIVYKYFQSIRYRVSD
uniref:Uncharacterized protein n=1 Tax=viral metagenome TaxID=1070528 RepID=A0A6C0LUG3_9ZZZZ